MELVTFDDLKSLLSLELSTIDDYPALSVIKTGVNAAIESYLGMPLGEESRTTVIYASIPRRSFIVDALPLVSVDAVYVDGESLSADSYVRTKNGILFNSFVSGIIEIEYTGGYSELTIPGAIKNAALYQVAYEWQQKDIIGSESVSTQQGVTRKPGLKMLDEVKDRLSPYRHTMVVA